ncbi:DUF2007 domain-containing protein [Salinimicrobium sp. CDJ15-81-2]|nr:DUF2007 domain-containing protein [Salinimicrobium nanhaiense]
MEFISIYSTQDDNEISILEDLFRGEGLNYEVHTVPTGDTGKPLQKRILVAADDREKARELLDQSGFIAVQHHSRTRRVKSKKLILVFLALLILVIVAIVITWFMNVE